MLALAIIIIIIIMICMTVILMKYRSMHINSTGVTVNMHAPISLSCAIIMLQK